MTTDVRWRNNETEDHSRNHRFCSSPWEDCIRTPDDEYLHGNNSLRGGESSPGVDAADTPDAGLFDSNGDGVFSEGEERASAQRVLGDLSITIGGQNVRPQLISWSFPQPPQMRSGLGEIHIGYTVDLPYGRTNRTLILTNHHLNYTSVYLMNVVSRRIATSTSWPRSATSSSRSTSWTISR
jgi:hypothetical protein